MTMIKHMNISYVEKSFFLFNAIENMKNKNINTEIIYISWKHIIMIYFACRFLQWCVMTV